MKWVATVLAGAVALAGCPTWAGEPAPLVLEAKIPLGKVAGRIDHFAVDPAGHRLFVAELGNNSVGVIDVQERKVSRRISGLDEPQGVGYVPATDTLYVANGGDGTVRLFQGADLSPAGQIALGDDADNVRVDPQTNRVFIGYGSGALAVVDPTTRAKVADIPLKAHPESFRIDARIGHAFVNVPDAAEVAVVDIDARKQVASWPVQGAVANFPMAIDEDEHRVLVVTRAPAKLIAFGEKGGASASLATCGDADDIFVDGKRSRIYVSCGEGAVDVFQRQGAKYEHIGRVPTASGARTSFFFQDADRLFVAVRASTSEPAAIWVFRPAP